MIVAALASNGTAPGRRVHFWCPGCDKAHGIVTDAPNSWTWNGDMERPTFTPSVLVHSHGSLNDAGERYETPQCHSFVTDGQIQFLDDSTHGLAGQTVPLPEWPYLDDKEPA